MPRGGTPIAGLRVQDIVLETSKLGPQGGRVPPEECVDWNGK